MKRNVYDIRHDDHLASKIIREYNEGVKTEDIVEKYGISQRTFYYIIHHAPEGELRPKGMRGRPIKCDSALIETARRMWEEGLSVPQIARELQLSPPTLYSAFDFGTTTYWMIQEKERAIQMVKDMMLEPGQNQSKLAKRLGVSQATIYNWTVGSCLPSVRYVKKIEEEWTKTRDGSLKSD